MKFISWLRKDRVAPLLTDDGLEARLRWALHEDAERLAGSDHMDPVRCGRLRCQHTWPLCGHSYLAPAERVVLNNCEPIPCDFEDNYVCARHSNG